jgi:hypothetical protein
MKERPILFSAPMVQAIRDGRKTQTRRPVTPQPPAAAVKPWCIIHSSHASRTGTWGWTDSVEAEPPRYVVDGVRCPLGVAGDQLWVREAFQVFERTSSEVDGQEWSQVTKRLRTDLDEPPSSRWCRLAYRADAELDEVTWRPSIHMPRWASRIQLESELIRVQRLHDITDEEAIAEGIAPLFTDEEMRRKPYLRNCRGLWRNYLWHGCARGKVMDQWRFQGSGYESARDSFSSLWESVYGAGSWAQNPWVWVVNFKRAEKVTQ